MHIDLKDYVEDNDVYPISPKYIHLVIKFLKIVINIFMASADISLSKLPGPLPIRIIEENIDIYSKKPSRKKAQLFHFPSNSIFQLTSLCLFILYLKIYYYIFSNYYLSYHGSHLCICFCPSLIAVTASLPILL